MQFCQVGEFESSKSAMNIRAPELRALMTIFRSTGPVISTRRSCSAAGTGSTRQSPSRTASVSGRKSGSSPSRSLTSRADRAASTSARRARNSRSSPATKASASSVRTFSAPVAGARISTPSGMRRL